MERQLQSENEFVKCICKEMLTYHNIIKNLIESDLHHLDVVWVDVPHPVGVDHDVLEVHILLAVVLRDADSPDLRDGAGWISPQFSPGLLNHRLQRLLVVQSFSAGPFAVFQLLQDVQCEERKVLIFRNCPQRDFRDTFWQMILDVLWSFSREPRDWSLNSVWFV